jgi:hypothetical protein
MDTTNWQMDWTLLEEEYQRYCIKCQDNKVVPMSFGDWFMVEPRELND